MMDEEKFESKKGDKVKTKFVARSFQEAQRIKLEKLMSDPTKPVIIPTTKQKKDFSNAIPSFIRNVMGSSAGAGSGEFHVYRHLRRKEYARQKHIQQKSKKETLDDEYAQKLEENRLKSEEKTAKKRAKRLKKKKNAKNKAKMPKMDKPEEKSGSESDDDDDTEEVEDGKPTDGNEDIETKPPNDDVTSDGDGKMQPESDGTGDTQEATKEVENVPDASSDKEEEGVNE